MRESETTMNPYEARQEARRARLERAAARATEESAAAHKRSHDMMAAIPMGQPILLNHHSEGRDRRYRDRAWNLLGKAVHASERAAEYASRAAAVGTAGISSDDPEAVDKLREKLAGLEAEQARDKTINKLVRRKDIPGLVALGMSEATAAKLLEPDFCGRIGIPAYVGANRNGNMRRILQRIAHLERLAVTPAAPEIAGEVAADPTRGLALTETVTGAGFTIEDSADENRIMIKFDAIPSKDVRTALKRSGFKWSPTRGAWVRMRGANALWAAKCALGVAE
jgi:hypothetical protein